jgi:hypothetical protein
MYSINLTNTFNECIDSKLTDHIRPLSHPTRSAPIRPLPRPRFALLPRPQGGGAVRGDYPVEIRPPGSPPTVDHGGYRRGGGADGECDAPKELSTRSHQALRGSPPPRTRQGSFSPLKDLRSSQNPVLTNLRAPPGLRPPQTHLRCSTNSDPLSYPILRTVVPTGASLPIRGAGDSTWRSTPPICRIGYWESNHQFQTPPIFPAPTVLLYITS